MIRSQFHSKREQHWFYLRLLSSADRAFSSSRLCTHHIVSVSHPCTCPCKRCTHLGLLDALQDLLTGLVRPTRMERLLLRVAIQARAELRRLEVARVIALLYIEDQPLSRCRRSGETYSGVREDVEGLLFRRRHDEMSVEIGV